MLINLFSGFFIGLLEWIFWIAVLLAIDDKEGKFLKL
jgi:hypothetical protein